MYPALYFVSEVNIRAAYSGCVTLKLVKETSGDFTTALFQLRGPISSSKCDKVMSWVATSFLEVMTILRTMANKVIMAGNRDDDSHRSKYNGDDDDDYCNCHDDDDGDRRDGAIPVYYWEQTRSVCFPSQTC